MTSRRARRRHQLRRRAPSSAAALLDALDAGCAARRSNRRRREQQAERAGRATPRTDDHRAEDSDWAGERREFLADDRQAQADRAETLDDEREVLADAREQQLRELAIDVGLHAASATAGTGSALGSTVFEAERGEAAAARADARRERRRADADLARQDFARPLTSHLLDIARLLAHTCEPDDATARIVAAAAQVVPGCDAASFSKLVGDDPVTVAATNPAARALDCLQYDSGQGPSLDALSTLHLVISDELAADSRWPDLAAAVAAAGVAVGAIASPIVDERDPVAAFGSLNNYGNKACAFDADARECVMPLTAHLGAVVTLAARAAQADTTTRQLSEAVATRDVIGQAKGILMERDRLTADEAFDVLKRASQRLNRRLRDVADDLTHTGEIAEDDRDFGFGRARSTGAGAGR